MTSPISPPQLPTPTLIPPPGPSAHTLQVSPSAQITTIPTSPYPPASQQFHDALSVRAAVYITEQKCSGAEEIDADDDISWHWILYATNEQGVDIPAATVRLVPARTHVDAEDVKTVNGPDYAGSKLWDHKEPYVKIGRLATIRAFRGRGYGRVLVQGALDFARENKGVMGEGEWKGLVLARAQRNVEGWYGTLGFERDEGMGVWLEEGIEHVGMWRRVEVGL